VMYRAVGCSVCSGRGYSGRRAIHEPLRLEPTLRKLISEGAGVDRLREAARATGSSSLRESGLAAVRAGITTAEEVLRVALDPT
jgi:general secretion pathway protein E